MNDLMHYGTEDAKLAAKKGYEWLIDQGQDLSAIDLAELNLEHCDTCVIGQLYGEFNSPIVEATGLDADDNDTLWEFAVEHGFDLPRDALYSDRSREAWLMLRNAWVELLTS